MEEINYNDNEREIVFEEIAVGERVDEIGPVVWPGEDAYVEEFNFVPPFSSEIHYF